MFDEEKEFQEQKQIICDVFDIKGADVILVKQRLDILRENLGRLPDGDEIDQ